MELLILAIFIIGYLAITLEHYLKVDKLIPICPHQNFRIQSLSLFNIYSSLVRKTALLQADALVLATGLPNVLLCAVAVHFFSFSSSEINSVVSFLGFVGYD